MRAEPVKAGGVGSAAVSAERRWANADPDPATTMAARAGPSTNHATRRMHPRYADKLSALIHVHG